MLAFLNRLFILLLVGDDGFFVAAGVVCFPFSAADSYSWDGIVVDLDSFLLYLGHEAVHGDAGAVRGISGIIGLGETKKQAHKRTRDQVQHDETIIIV